MLAFLRALLECYDQSLLVVGGQGGGRISLLKAIYDAVPGFLRILHVGYAPFLPRSKKNTTFTPLVADADPTWVAQLGRTAMAAPTDTVVYEEFVGPDAWAVLNACARKTAALFTSVQADSIESAFVQLEDQCLQSSREFTRNAVRGTVSRAFQFALEIRRFDDGTRKVRRICEVRPNVDGTRELVDLFVFEESGYDKNRRLLGNFVATSHRPLLFEKWRALGKGFTEEMFK